MSRISDYIKDHDYKSIYSLCYSTTLTDEEIIEILNTSWIEGHWVCVMSQTLNQEQVMMVLIENHLGVVWRACKFQTLGEEAIDYIIDNYPNKFSIIEVYEIGQYQRVLESQVIRFLKKGLFCKNMIDSRIKP